MAVKRAFVSDVHMTWGKSLKKEMQDPAKAEEYEWLDLDEAAQVARFLEELYKTDVKEVILLGDIMDDWLYPHDIPAPSYRDIADADHVKRITEAVRKLTGKLGTHGVTYVAGNHDMGIMDHTLDAFRASVFKDVQFTSGPYERDGIYAEHGHQYLIWNDNDPAHIVPVGYYITRLLASVHAYTNGMTYTIPQLAGALANKNSLVDDPLTFLQSQLQQAGNHAVSDKTIVGTCADPAVCRTFADVLRTYADLPKAWQKKHAGDVGIMAPWKSVTYEIGGLWDMARELVFHSDTRKVILFGHTHTQDLKLLEPMGQNPDHKEYWGIYANCGSWCEYNAVNPRPYSWVLTESEGDKHLVSLMNWDWRRGASRMVRQLRFPVED